MFSKLSFTCLLLASAAIVHAQEPAPPPEPSPSEAASEHEPPKSQAAAAAPAAESKAPKWDVEHPRGLTTRKVPFYFSPANVPARGKYSCQLQLKQNARVVDEKSIAIDAVEPDAQRALAEGAMAAGTRLQIVDRRPLPPDFPTTPGFPEANYLKFVVAARG